MPLTKRQKEVLDYLVAFETKHGYAPSFEEIGKGLKLTSLATVHKHITTLEKKGFIRRGYNQSRSIEIIQLPKSVKEQVSDRKLQELPLVGRIAAGRPLEAVEERETISLGDFARGGNSFVLQVKGTSMIEDHIMDGDFVVCEQTQVANAGDIVVALIGGEEATLKRFYREGPGKIRLQPANSERSEEHTSELQSRLHLVCRLLLEKKKNTPTTPRMRTRTLRSVPVAEDTRRCLKEHSTDLRGTSRCVHLARQSAHPAPPSHDQ